MLTYAGAVFFAVGCFFSMGKTTVANFEEPAVQTASLEASVQTDENVQFLTAYLQENKVATISYLQGDGHSLKVLYLLESGQEIEMHLEKSPFELKGSMMISQSVVDKSLVAVSTDPKDVNKEEIIRKIADIERMVHEAGISVKNIEKIPDVERAVAGSNVSIRK